MITREQLRELAQFQSEGAECALSFYFQPQTPHDRSHREESILAKDLVRTALRAAEKNGKDGHMRADLNKVLDLVSNLRGGQARSKAVFACGDRGIWREFDLPPQLPATQLFVNRRFHLKPLALLLGAQSRLWLALVDRHKARFFDVRLDELKEHEGLFQALPHRGRGDGYAGYDGGHSERSVHDQVLHHFKNVAAHLQDLLEKKVFENLIIGCQDNNWHEFEPHLHPYVRKRLLGRFAAEVGNITEEQIREQAGRIQREALDQRRQSLVREVLGQAKSNSRGVTGLRRVLRSLELGEVQTLLLGENYHAQAVQCASCGHLDAHMVRLCPVCGRSTQELEEVCDAIIPAAILRDIELLYINDDPEFDMAGNIAALLRFRADQSSGSRMATAS
jgi:peptide subunit release factor 1 (eRF1)